MKSGKRVFRNLKFGLIGYFVIMLTIASAMTMAIFDFLYSKTLEDNALGLVSNLIEQTSYDIEYFNSVINNVCLYISSDKTVVQESSAPPGKTDPAADAAINDLLSYTANNVIRVFVFNVTVFVRRCFTVLPRDF